MPTYHYRCTACGHSFDKFQKFSEDTLTDCPECSGLIRRVPQAVGIVFKGSGWYVNDSRDSKKSDSKATSSSSSKDSNGAAKTEGGTEKAKPDKAPTESAKAPAAASAE